MTQFKHAGEFYRSLAFLSKSGVTLSNGLLLLSKSMPIPKEQALCRQLYKGVLEGRSLSQSFRKAGFPIQFTTALQAAELSGKLDDILFWYADFEENNQEITRHLKQSLTQPMLTLAFALLVLLALPPLVLRDQLLALAENGGDLPFLSQSLLVFSGWMTNPATLLLIPFGWVVFQRGRTHFQSENGRNHLEYGIGRLPILGEIAKRVAVSRTLFLFGLLLEAGIRIDQAMAVASQGSGSLLLQKSCNQAVQMLRAGRPLARCIEAIDWLLPSTYQLMKSGEDCGKLSELTRLAAKLEEERFRQQLQTLTALAQPLIFTFLGVVVCLMALAIMAPTVSLLKFL